MTSRIAVYVTLLATVASILFIYDNYHLRRLDPFEDIALKNILLAKSDAAGDVYIIDSGMGRITKMGSGFADYEIMNTSTNPAFYNAYDVAAEDEESLFVHDVIWDSSGMSVASERILEFDKKSGAPRRELYRLDRSGAESDPELSGLISLRGLKFGDGKLWFVRKNPNFFALYSLIPGEEPVAEFVAAYNDALWTLDDFAIDIAWKRVFFADKAGVIRVFSDGETKTVFRPVSGISVREFSLPYRLSFDGAELYFSDIGKRALMRLDGENKAKILCGGWEDVPAPPLRHFVHSRGDLLTLAGMDSIVGLAPDGREIWQVSSIAAGRKIVLFRVCFWVSALVILSSSFMIAAVILRLARNGKMSGKEGLLFAIIASAVLTFATIAPATLDSVKTEAKDEIMNRLSYVLEVSSKILDAEAFTGINTPQDYNRPAYRKFRSSLNGLMNRGNEWNGRIYCDVFKFEDDIQYSVCYLDGTIGAFANPRNLDDSGARVIAESGEWIKNMNYQDASGNYMFLSGPIYDAKGGVAGGIEIGVDISSLENTVFTLSKNLMVRSLLMLVLALFLVSEILEYIPAQIRPGIEGEGEIPFRLFRPVTFLVFLAFNLSTAFLPNYALRMESSFMGLSPNISAVLPITVSDVVLTAAPLISPFLIARLGFRLSFSLSLILCAAGYALCAAAATIAALIVGMAVLGLGAGVLFTLLQTCIAFRDDVGERALGFSAFTASSFSGINCGIMIGGIIAVDFSQKTVFLFGSCLWIFIMTAFLVLSGKRTAARTTKTPVVPSRHRSAPAGGILAFLLLSFFPFTLYSGFIYYLVPVFGGQAGMSDAEISLVFIFFGAGIMFLGSKIVAFVRGGTVQISYFLRLAIVMEICGILCFALYRSIAAMVMAVFILGCACGIGNVYFPLYLTEMPEVKMLKEGNAIAMLNFTENLGFAAGPMIFSVVFHSKGSLGYYVLAALMFLLPLLYSVKRHKRIEARP